MSYVSGFMMGAALAKNFRQFFMPQGAGRGQGRFSRLTYGTAGARRPLTSYASARVGRQPQSSGLLPFSMPPFKRERALELVSATKGRRRYRAKSLSSEMALLLEMRLQKYAYLKTVEINAATGSILLLYNPQQEKRVAALGKWLETVVAGSRSAGLEGDRVALEQEKAYAGALLRSVRGTVLAFSAWLKRRTHGYLDLSIVAAALFALRGVFRMIVGKDRASGPQLFWWAVSLLRGWRTL